jgi:hypothetical protein
MDETIRTGFAALRAQIGAQQAQIDALEQLVVAALPGPQAPTPCAHEETEDAGSTLGNHMRRRCTQCHAIVTA